MPVRVSFLVAGLERGGTELRLLELAQRLPDDLAVHLCATTGRVPLRDAFERAGASVTVVPIAKPWREWAGVRAVAREVQAAGVQVLNTFDLKDAIIAFAARRLVEPRPRHVHHLVDLQFGATPPQRAMLWRLLQRVDHVVCDAQSVREEVVGTRRLRPPVSVIPNGVDTAHFAPDHERRRRVRAALALRDGDILLGAVANFRPEKNHALLLRAVERLRRDVPGLRLVCVGGGPLLDDMRTLARTLGVVDAVTFTGHVEDVRDYLAAMDLFVLPSTRDAFSNAVLQAMAMGVPCICSRTGEHGALFAGERHGLLFDPTSVEDCVDAVRRAAIDRDMRRQLSVDGRQLVRERFSSAAMVTAYAELLRQVARPFSRERPRDGRATLRA
jgi:glycosyltransferase involved in cell wall biosynthesis